MTGEEYLRYMAIEDEDIFDNKEGVITLSQLLDEFLIIATKNE